MKDLAEIIIKGYDSGESIEKMIKKMNSVKVGTRKKGKKAGVDKTKKMK